MIREFDTGQAVVLNGDGKVLWQLEEPRLTPSGKWKYAHILVYHAKGDAERMARKMGFPTHHVTRVHGRLGFDGWTIKYDARFPYYLACWEV